jgi:acyl-CoA thioesterase-1
VAQDRSLMQADGYHPNAKAQPRLLENVWSVLKKAL